MADLPLPESVPALFAVLTGALEDAAAIAAAAQGCQTRVEARHAIHQLQPVLRRIDRQLGQLEVDLK